MISEFPATAGMVDREPIRRDQVRLPGAGACCVERRMFDEPDQFIGGTITDCRRALFHEGHRFFIVYQAFLDAPLDRR